MSARGALDAAEAGVVLEEASCVVCGGSGEADREVSSSDYEYATTAQRFTFVRCRRCAHCYLNPRPTIDSASVIYPEDYYTRSSDHARDGAPLLGRIKDFVVMRRLGTLVRTLPSGAAVLDVGAGDGSLLLALRRRRPDLSLTALDSAFTPMQTRNLEEHRISRVEAMLEHAALPAGAFDLVIMNQVIEHLWDVPGGLARLHQAMRAGAALSVSTPNLNGYDRRLFGEYWGNYYVPRHLNLFSSVTLPQILEKRGFIVRMTRQLAAPLVWVRNLQYLCKGRGSSLHRLFTDHNLPALAMFTALDEVMRIAGWETSNLQCVAVKSAHSRFREWPR